MEEALKFNKYLFWAVTLLLLVLSFFIIRHFIIALISAFILAYLVKPVYNKLWPKIGKSAASFLCVVFVVFVIVIPFLLIVGELARQIIGSFDRETIRSVLSSISSLPFLDKIDLQTGDFTEKIFSFAFSTATSLIAGLPLIILSIVVTLLGIYYILKNWELLSERIKSYIPFKNKEGLLCDMGRATNRIVYGYALIAIIEFVISFIGFYFSGVEYFILLPALIAILAFVPSAGPMLVWLPVAVYYFLTGSIATGIGVMITGLIISIGIDNLVGPHILGRASKIHPFIMFIGILGGISVFGIIGFIIGPLILVYTLEILEEIRQGKS